MSKGQKEKVFCGFTTFELKQLPCGSVGVVFNLVKPKTVKATDERGRKIRTKTTTMAFTQAALEERITKMEGRQLDASFSRLALDALNRNKRQPTMS